MHVRLLHRFPRVGQRLGGILGSLVIQGARQGITQGQPIVLATGQLSRFQCGGECLIRCGHLFLKCLLFGAHFGLGLL